jgi:hypothetical protein
VLPRSWADRVQRFFLGKAAGQPFPVPGEKEFNRAFAVVGDDPDAILDCLTPAVIDTFLDDRKLALETAAGMMLVYHRDTTLTAREHERFLNRADRLARELGSPH